ncbi:MAG: glycoside hydrolase N-terminal domain-containing protein [Lachnospiraceae bacterium]|nr:glycoside hydrolase N-terminal domain-containing protein [Lachnospiraceae bacterium]
MENLKCTTEAARWGEAFPIGNGHMGAMIYGGVKKEQIDLSENTFFSGSASRENSQPGSAEAFYRMRKQIDNSEYDAAHETAEQFMGVRHDYGTNLPVGKIWITYQESGEPVQEYVRELSMEEGTVYTRYERGPNPVERRAWMAHSPNLLVYEVTAGQPFSCCISYEGYTKNAQIKAAGSSLTFIEYAHETMHCDETTGVALGGFVKIETDGNVQVEGTQLRITEATGLVLLLSMDTDFQKAGKTIEECVQTAADRIEAVDMEGLECIRRNHIAETREAMDACTLELNGAADQETSLAAQLFQYGRYLLWSASREDSRLPAHLQGIWNDNVACRIGWTCDMHLDINTQMNYWPAEVTNLPGTAKPLFRWIKEDLVESGARSARENYGLNGWVAEIVSNAWAFTTPYWGVPIAPCPTGGVWILTHMWEHYAFTGDLEFLEQEAFAPLEGAAEFFADYVFLKDGRYQCGPAISPENSFQIGEKVYQISNSCTYELTMIRELFTIYRKACVALHRESEPLYQKTGEILEKLVDFRILQDGTLAEWQHDYPAADRQHRHTSHLLGLFPFDQITLEKTPLLAQAAKATLREKLDPPEGWEDTGWARSMLMLYEARLQDGEAAYGHIRSMLEHLLEPNGMIIHPPTRGAGSFAPVYEMDGNTGLTSCIAEMLLQSHGNQLHLLPALPGAWKSGRVRGLRARGNVTVDMEWNEEGTVEITLYSTMSQRVQVVCDKKLREVYLLGGQPFLLSFQKGQEEGKRA